MSFNLNTYLILGGFLINLSAAVGSYFNALSDIKTDNRDMINQAIHQLYAENKTAYVSKEEFVAYKDLLLDLRNDVKKILVNKQ